MRTFITTTALALAAMTSIACAPADDGVGQDESFVKDSGPQYFIVTRQDYRKCMYPMCGGWFAKAVNKSKTTCADGAKGSECHVNELDASALGLSDDDAYELDAAFGSGQALVLGKLRSVDSEWGTVKTIVVEEAWAAQAEVTPSGTFYGVALNGVKCITWPCPSFDGNKLNSTSSLSLAGVDLAASGASQEALDAAYEALVDGVLVAGKLHKVTGPGGTMKELVASEFYLPWQAAKPAQMCGGFGGFTCADGEVCNIDLPNACGGADLAGTCVARPDACIELYAPVCGCDGVTYSNDCFRIASGAQLDHDGACDASVE